MTMIENTVKGKIIYFTGKFELDPQYRAEQLGATIVESMSEDVDWVVLGAGHSSTGLEQAHNLGIKLLDERMFFQLVDPIAWNERLGKDPLEVHPMVKRKTQEVDVSKLNASFWTDPKEGDFGMFTKAGNRKVATVIKAAYSMSEESDEDVARFVHKELNKIEKKHSEVHDTVVREGIVAALGRSRSFDRELSYLEIVDSMIAPGHDRATAEAFAGQIKLFCEEVREPKLREDAGAATPSPRDKNEGGYSVS